MALEHDIALKTTHEIVYSGKPFTFESLQQSILDKGGILRISPGFTIGEYITELEEDKIIYFNPNIKKFELCENYSMNK